MKKLQENKGITLLALIITIIVLLILAVVAISAVNGDGIISKAKIARTNYQGAQEKEYLALAGYQAILDNINNEGNGGGKSTSNDPTSLVNMYKNGEIEIGDYVAYTPNAGTSYTALATDTGTSENQIINAQDFTWRVMGLDENENLLLVSSAPTTESLDFEGYIGYNNFETVLNNVCSTLYGSNKTGITAKNMTMQDVERLIGAEAVKQAKIQHNITSEGLKIDGYVADGINYTSNYRNTFNGIYTPSNWTNTNNNVELENTIYYFDLEDIEDYISNTKAKELIFGIDKDYYYHLASTGVRVLDFRGTWSSINIDISGISSERLCDSDGVAKRGYAAPYCLRPVISFTSAITTSDFAVSKTGTVSKWDDPLGYNSASS